MTIAVKWLGQHGDTRLLVALLAMGVPVVAGSVCGAPRTGLLMGIGAVLLGEGAHVERTPNVSALRVFVVGLAPAWAALGVDLGLARAGLGDAGLIAVAFLAGLAITHSRLVAVLAVRFVIYLVLGAEILGHAGAHRTLAAFVLGLGILWNLGVRMALGVEGEKLSLLRQGRKAGRWPANSVRHLRFWQYALRLAVGLMVASAFRHIWPGCHGFWAMLTVAMLTMPIIERPPARIWQRLHGTLAGVIAAAPILALGADDLHLAEALVLACVLPWARQRGYVWQTMVTTPLILLVVQWGAVFAPSVLTERLMATLLGGMIVLLLNSATNVMIPQRE